MLKLKASSFLLATMLVAGAISAQESVIFVHGRSGTHCDTSGGYTTDINNYWGSAKSITTSASRYYVGYDGASDPRTWGTCRAQSKLYQVLEARCKGSMQCTIICHSAGCYASQYFINKSSTTYNIRRIWASSSAAGGSELANAAFWESNSMVDALKTGNARGSFNHNDTRGKWIYAIAGYEATWTGASVILPGEDDGAVAYHSTCGINTTGSYSSCLSGTRYSYHTRWAGGASGAEYSSSKNGYHKVHTGDGSNSINTAAKSEWNRCKSLGSGCL
ncbi:MAG: hypothetical protein HS115_17385 [Spirochaetales bacterium]|nr:hypothetical protein [Spirochaetales bacterium]